MDDSNTTLPAEWYGLNYLGRPASVAVMGQSPTASASGAPTGGAAIPTSGIGTTGPTSSTVPGATPASSSATEAVGEETGSGINKGLAALGLTQNVAGLTGQATKAASSSGPTVAPNQVPLQSFTGKELSSPEFDTALSGGTPEGGEAFMSLETPVGSKLVSEPAPTAPEGVPPSDLASMGLNAIQIGEILASLSGASIPKGVSEGTNIAGGLASLMAPGPLTVATLPLAISNLVKEFGGPPSTTFPSTAWPELSNAVSYNLPPKIPVPQNATPEQLASINAANQTIDYLKNSFTGDLPSYLGGKQSAQTWGTVMQTLQKQATDAFSTLQNQYGPALEAAQASGALTPEFSSQLQSFSVGPQPRALQDLRTEEQAARSRLPVVLDPNNPEHQTFLAGTGLTDQDIQAMSPQAIEGLLLPNYNEGLLLRAHAAGFPGYDPTGLIASYYTDLQNQGVPYLFPQVNP